MFVINADKLISRANLGWISVEHHQAKVLRTDAGEVDAVGVTGGHDAVEQRQPLLAGVAITPTVILRAWSQRNTTEFKTDTKSYGSTSQTTVELPLIRSTKLSPSTATGDRRLVSESESRLSITIIL